MLEAIATPAAWEDLAGTLSGWLPRQRWYAGKARSLSEVVVEDTVTLPHDGAARLLDVLVQARYTTGGIERYQVPLVAAGETADLRPGGAMLSDLGRDPDAVAPLCALALSGGAATTATGRQIIGHPVRPGIRPALASARALGVEQSNTSVVFGDRLMLKLFRRLEPGGGENPDVEVTRALAELGFPNVPAQRGALTLACDDSPTSLAVVSDFLPQAREGWEIAVEEAARLRAGTIAPTSARLPDRIRELGSVVARLHDALARAFGTHVLPANIGEQWSDGMVRQLEEVLRIASERHPVECGPVLRSERAITERLTDIRSITDLGTAIRTHGDLHLGQVLLDPDLGWQVIDFEGEPARSLDERHAPHSPLRDLAGMLRSFDYAAGQVDRAVGQPLGEWRDRLRSAFLDGYRAVPDAASLLPRTATDHERLLMAFELDKAVYELGYEIANRPAWVPIPSAGIVRLCRGAQS